MVLNLFSDLIFSLNMATADDKKQNFQNALDRAKAIASRMKGNMSKELLKRPADSDHYANEQQLKLNPYGSGTGLPTNKSDMVLPKLMGMLSVVYWHF